MRHKTNMAGKKEKRNQSSPWEVRHLTYMLSRNRDDDGESVREIT